MKGPSSHRLASALPEPLAPRPVSPARPMPIFDGKKPSEFPEAYRITRPAAGVLVAPVPHRTCAQTVACSRRAGCKVLGPIPRGADAARGIIASGGPMAKPELHGAGFDTPNGSSPGKLSRV